MLMAIDYGGDDCMENSRVERGRVYVQVGSIFLDVRYIKNSPIRNDTVCEYPDTRMDEYGLRRA